MPDSATMALEPSNDDVVHVPRRELALLVSAADLLLELQANDPAVLSAMVDEGLTCEVDAPDAHGEIETQVVPDPDLIAAVLKMADELDVETYCAGLFEESAE